jgi:hypothetical protein
MITLVMRLHYLRPRRHQHGGIDDRVGPLCQQTIRARQARENSAAKPCAWPVELNHVTRLRPASQTEAHRNVLFGPEKPGFSSRPKPLERSGTGTTADARTQCVLGPVFAASPGCPWVIYLGTVAQEDDWLPMIHRRHRCDLSLFQLGLRLLDYHLYHDQPIPSSFAIELETVRL